MLTWQLRDRTLTLGPSPLVMGIVNVTPDSFSDGGRHFSLQAAVQHAHSLIEEGADILDLGGESTRPGSQPISLDEELRRVVPVVEALRPRTQVLLSIDTSKAEVARRCLEAGADIINDVTALTGAPGMPEVILTHRPGIVLMHMQGSPATMQQNPRYDDVAAEVTTYLEERLHHLAGLGMDLRSVVVDPGIGFGKTTEHNLELLARLDALGRLGRPVLLGVSRKGFMGRLPNNRPAEERVAASLGAFAYTLAQGTVHIVRVHDVRATRDVVQIFAAIAARRRPVS